MSRMRVVMILASLAFAFMTQAAAAQSPITIQISPQNNSGISGTATLTPMGNQTRVVLNLQGTPQGGNHPAHIHAGTCANLDPRPAFPLTNVQNGMSETTVNVSIDQIRAAQHAINVHKSPQEASVYVGCGNLPTGGGSAAPAAMPRTGAGGAAGLPVGTLAGLGGLLLVAAGGLAALKRRRAS